MSFTPKSNTLLARNMDTAGALEKFKVARYTTFVRDCDTFSVFRIEGHSEWAGVGAQEWEPAEFVITEKARRDTSKGQILNILGRFPCKGFTVDED